MLVRRDPCSSESYLSLIVDGSSSGTTRLTEMQLVQASPQRVGMALHFRLSHPAIDIACRRATGVCSDTSEKNGRCGYIAKPLQPTE